MTSLINVGIYGLGSSLPDRNVSNADFLAMGLDTSDEWITSRTGIKNRRIAKPEESTSDFAVEAGKRAIANAGLTPDDIDLIIVATSSPDYPSFPSTACLVQDRLGCRKIPAFDMTAACSGFVYAMITAQQFIATGTAKYVLVIGADVLSKWLDWQDRGTCILFGDGAGAVVLGPVKAGYGILSSNFYADGSGANQLITPSGGTRQPITSDIIANRTGFLKMDGRAVFKFATSVIISSTDDALCKAGLSRSDINWFIPHQANTRIFNFAGDKLGLTDQQICQNIARVGNTSAASIPMVIEDYQTQFKTDDILVLVGFGAGLTWGTVVLRWGGS